MNKDDAINNAKIKINSFEWYVPQYTPSLEQESLFMKPIKNKVPTEHYHIERSVFMHEIKKLESMAISHWN